MALNTEQVARDVTVREGLDSGDLLPGAVRVSREPFAEETIETLTGFGMKLSKAQREARELYLGLRAERSQAVHEAAIIRERMRLWDRDRLAWDAAATLAAGSYQTAELWLLEPHDVEGLEHGVRVLTEAERIALREFQEAMYRDPSFDDKVAEVWSGLRPPGDLLAKDLPEYRRQAMKAAGILRAYVMGHARYMGIEPRTDEARTLSKRLKAALDGELGAGTFPTINVLDRESESAAAELRLVEAAAAEAQLAVRERDREDARAGARSRNPQREEVSA